MPPISIKFMEKELKELERRVKALQKTKITTGFFQESGQHPTAGMSYVDLATLHANGVPSENIPVRDPLYLAYKMFEINGSVLKKDLQGYLSNLKGKPMVSIKTLGMNWGQEFGEDVKSIFGDEGFLKPNAAFTKSIKLAAGVDPSKPLVFDGYLRDSVSFKIDPKLYKVK